MFIPLLTLVFWFPIDPPPAALAGTNLQNVIVLADGAVINGSAPRTDADFAALARSGVQTIIAVDGALPAVEPAARHGLRYVHLPISYDGISPERLRSCARVVTQLPGPVYVHCLHGRHRSPAVSAATLVALGRLSPTEGVALLETAGTSPRYAGLYEAVRAATPLSGEVLAGTETFPSRARPTTLVGQMVELDRVFESLDHLRRTEWRPTPDAPDLDAAHLARQLREQLQAIRPEPRAPQADQQRFRKELADSLKTAQAFADALKTGDRKATTTQFESVRASCRSCHASFRDRRPGRSEKVNE